MRWLGTLGAYLRACAGVVLGTLFASPLRGVIDLSNLALLYVLAVVITGVRYGRGPAVVSALLGSLAFAYVFVPPHFSLAITEGQYILSALIMLGVALVVGHLTSALKRHAEFAEEKSLHSKALYDLARQLTGALTPVAVAEITARFLAEIFQAGDSRIILPADFPSPPPPASAALLNSCVERKHLVSCPTLPGHSFVLLPLQASTGLLGILGFDIDSAKLTSKGYAELLETMGSVVAVALERAHYAEVARESEIKHAAESLRSSILSALSHDLRTPLTALVGMADTLALGRISPERQRAMLLALRGRALAINQLVTNLLDMARLRSGAIELNEAWQPIEEVIGSVLQSARSQWEEREIAVHIPPDLPPLRFDAVLIERVLWNLLENACKYSPAERPIELRVRRQEEQVEVAVCDRGPGLPPGDAEDLFGLFRRGQAESDIPGVGLGLAIARSIAEAHGGEVGAGNRPGGGACFWLRLRLGNPPSLRELEDTGPPVAGNGREKP